MFSMRENRRDQQFTVEFVRAAHARWGRDRYRPLRAASTRLNIWSVREKWPKTALLIQSPSGRSPRPESRKFALLADGALVEVVHRRDAEMQPGAIYAGRVGARTRRRCCVCRDRWRFARGPWKTKAPPPEVPQVTVSVVVPARPSWGPELKSVKHALTEEFAARAHRARARSGAQSGGDDGSEHMAIHYLRCAP